MQPTITATYLGQLRTECRHTASGSTITTDAPVDNHGKGEAFSPTDLCCTALASCAMTIMGIEAEKMGKPLNGTRIDITKTMAANPRYISKIEITYHIPGTFTRGEKDILQNAATTCPVCLTLGPSTSQVIQFDWMD